MRVVIFLFIFRDVVVDFRCYIVCVVIIFIRYLEFFKCDLICIFLKLNLNFSKREGNIVNRVYWKSKKKKKNLLGGIFYYF